MCLFAQRSIEFVRRHRGWRRDRNQNNEQR
jgi:hypothetical protein